MLRKLNYLIMVISIFSLQLISGNDVGTKSAQFLKIPVGARATALGGAYTAISDDIYAAYYNPAGLTSTNKFGATFQHNSWIADIDQEYIGLSYRLDAMNVISLSANILDVGGDRKTSENDDGSFKEYLGDWDAKDMYLGVSYARFINSVFSIGGTLKYIKSDIAGVDADAYALDLGFLSSFIEKDLKFGLSVQNLGTKLKYIDKKESLPIIYRAGVSYKFGEWLFAGDAIKPNDNDLKFVFGIEYKLTKNFNLRAGWDSDDDLSNSGISAGLGMSFKSFNLDYSFTPKEDFDDVHRISINFDI